MSRRVMTVYGTRPEGIKLAPVVRALHATDGFEPIVVVTGQHREMLDQVNSFFGVEPGIDLDLMAHGSTPNAIARRVLAEMETILEQQRPDALVVQGDTTSAFAASLAGFLARVPVVHVEAGLRTGDMQAPFPEEANRRLTSVVASLHLAPTPRARDHLLAEGIDPGAVLVTGNTVVDALQWAVRRHVDFSDVRLESLGQARRLVLVTTHRRESWGRPMEQAMWGVADTARAHPEVDFLLPLHRNKVVRDAVLPVLGDVENVILTEPLGYAEFAQMMNRSLFIVTDSGGIQEEAPTLGKPVLVLRDTTERPEGVAAGAVRLIGTERTRVAHEMERLLTEQQAYSDMAHSTNPYGDGHASRRVVAAIGALLEGVAMPEPFSPASTHEASLVAGAAPAVAGCA